MESILSIPDYVYLRQPKRFNESAIDQNCLLKVEGTFFCFDNKLFFSSRLHFLVYCDNYLKSTIYMLSKMVRNYSQQLGFSKYYNLTFLFRFSTRFRFCLNLTMSKGFFNLLALFLRCDMMIICFRRFLLRIGFLIPSKKFCYQRSMFI